MLSISNPSVCIDIFLLIQSEVNTLRPTLVMAMLVNIYYRTRLLNILQWLADLICTRTLGRGCWAYPQFNRGESKLSYFPKFRHLVSGCDNPVHSEFVAHMTMTQERKIPVVDWTMAPKIFTSESLEPVNVSLHGKRDLAGMIELRVLREADYPGLSLWAHHVLTNVLKFVT